VTAIGGPVDGASRTYRSVATTPRLKRDLCQISQRSLMLVSMSRFQKATGTLEFHPKGVKTDLRKEPKEISRDRELFP